ncbi:MAG: hypothetical protein J6W49_00330 [Paludibacteraceae bacterium]|nr:hypothetical protein [Paludibacteraceae bacterium]MBP5136319.1 hypothetical protein [Paludibacteraceae bacterium]MBP5741876.1 hypothetical protein [Paludibacteraceae bacterium]
MPSDWNHAAEYKKKKRAERDSFWWGFIPSFLLPIILNIVFFTSKYTTSQPLHEAMYKMANKGMLSKDMMGALVPSLLLIIVFSSFRKEKASIGAFVGLCPALIVALIFM